MAKPYRPSNGTEGEWFMGLWCMTCLHEKAHRLDPDADPCSIATWAMAMSITDPDYPEEWQVGDNGPRCTAYWREGDADPCFLDPNAVIRPLL